jgi:hypothetical protein
MSQFHRLLLGLGVIAAMTLIDILAAYLIIVPGHPSPGTVIPFMAVIGDLRDDKPNPMD